MNLLRFMMILILGSPPIWTFVLPNLGFSFVYKTFLI